MKNQLKTVILLASLSGLLLWTGQLIGGVNGLGVMLVFALLMNVGSYWYSDKIVLRMYNARRVTREEAPGIHSMIDELSKRAKIPKPRVYLVPTEVPNAFATGRNPKNSAVAVTSGILKVLSKEELKGVLAHELAHISNRDTLITTIAATIATVISYIAYIAQWAAIFGGFGGRDNEGGSNILSFLILVVLTPIIASILQLALSRSREYLADETGAKYCRTGQPLASALLKLESATKIMPMKGGVTATEGLFIVNPFRKDFFINLLSTHPSTASRVERLKKMRFY